MTLARLFSCAFGHDTPLMTRDSQSQAVWQCPRCLADLGPVLSSEMLDGPAKAQSEVLGRPRIQAQRVTKANITPMRRESSR